MINRRFKISLYLMIFVTSVFFISCGEPSFCTLNNVKIQNIRESDVKFDVIGTEEDLSMVTDGPGLLVFYYISEEKNNFSATTSLVRTEFKSLTTYGFRFSDSDNYNSFIFELKESSEDIKQFYAFAQKTGRRVEANAYCRNLFPFISGKNINKTFFIKSAEENDPDDTGLTKKFILSDGIEEVALYSKEIRSIINDDSKTKPQYVHIFVAFGSPVGSFSNSYWSDAEYVGTIKFKDNK